MSATAEIPTIPTIKRTKNQSSTPYRTIQDALDSVNIRNQDNAGLYYITHNWLFCDFFGVFTPQRQEITVHQIPGIPPARWREFAEACDRYRNLEYVAPVVLGAPERIEFYSSGKFVGTPGRSDRRWVEEWISHEVYPIQGTKHSLNRKAVDSIRKLAFSGQKHQRKLQLQWWSSSADGVYLATCGEKVGIISAIVPNK